MYYDDYDDDYGKGSGGCLMMILVIIAMILLYGYYLLVMSLVIGIVVGLIMATVNYVKATKLSLDTMPLKESIRAEKGFKQIISDVFFRLKDIFSSAKLENAKTDEKLEENYSNEGRFFYWRWLKGCFHFGRHFGLTILSYVLNSVLTLFGGLLAFLTMLIIFVLAGCKLR